MQPRNDTAPFPDPPAPAAPSAGPFPAMPSRTLIDLAQNQFEHLAATVTYPTAGEGPSPSKIESVALYLPQENQYTGQLEFVPSAMFPCPTSERVFLAPAAGSGLPPPTIPKTLSALPGFAHAQSLIPAYPFAASQQQGEGSVGAGAATVGTVEEVMCDVRDGGRRGSALSVPLFFGSRTVGVVLIWPTEPPQGGVGDDDEDGSDGGGWTGRDRELITRAALSVAMALSLDAERAATQRQSEEVKNALADNLHQVKNPIQAMRTFAKVLQRRIALEETIDMEGLGGGSGGGDGGRRGGRDVGGRNADLAQLLALAENMMVQSDRVVDLLGPMDGLVDATTSAAVDPSPIPPFPHALLLIH